MKGIIPEVADLTMQMTGRLRIYFLQWLHQSDGTAVKMLGPMIDSMDEFEFRNRIKVVCININASTTETKGGICFLLQTEIIKREEGCSHIFCNGFIKTAPE